jgi:hypothetical protein
MAVNDWLERFLGNTNAAQSALIQAAGQGPKTALAAPMHFETAAENAPQGTGPVGHPSRNIAGTSILLRSGAQLPRPLGGPGAMDRFNDFAVTRPDGSLMEAHDYGRGDVRFFKRKNPALLEAAARLAATQRMGHGAGAQAQAVAAMSPDDQERIRRLLGA